MKKFPIYYDWVQTLLKYNNELIEIVEQKEKLNDHIHSGERKLIDINNSNDNNEPNVMIPFKLFLFLQRNEYNYNYYFRMLFPAFFSSRMRNFEPKMLN